MDTSYTTDNYYSKQLRLKKKELLKKRRRRRRRQCRLCVLLILTIGIFLMGKMAYNQLFNGEERKVWEDEEEIESKKTLSQTIPVDKSDFIKNGYSPELYDELKECADIEPELEVLINNFSEYPEKIIEMLISNPETLEFVLEYPENIRNVSEYPQIDITNECNAADIPLFIQWDKRWGYNKYGNSVIGLSGCGPTCLSMVAAGLLKNTELNPLNIARFSENGGYISSDNGTSWSLMTEGAEKLGLSSKEIPLDEKVIINRLQKGNPIICSMRPGDFTKTGHFIVLYGYKDGKILINDPNSMERSNREWLYSDIEYQIKNMWCYTVD